MCPWHCSTKAMTSRNRVQINVGGQRFVTQWTTLRRPQCSRLSALSEADPHYDAEAGEFYFDRSGEIFERVLDLHRTGSLHIPHDICIPRILEDLQFWEVPLECIACCCWVRIREHTNRTVQLHKVHKTFESDTLHGLGKYSPPQARYPDNPESPFIHYSTTEIQLTWLRRLRNSVWMILDKPSSSYGAKVWALFYLCLVSLSIFVLCAESESSYWASGCRMAETECQTDSDNATHTANGISTWLLHNTSIVLLADHKHLQTELLLVELVTTAFFTLEVVVRLTCCPDLRAYLTSLQCWLDITSTSCAWVVLHTYCVGAVQFIDSSLIINTIIVLRSLRTFRVFKVFKIIRGWEVLTLALKASLWEICVLCVFFFTGMLIFSTLMYYAEYSNPETFPNIHIGFWWSIVTMTTVGYGDAYPTTSCGYLVGAACAILGMFATSLPIPIISENFSRLRLIFQLLDDFKNRKTLTVDSSDLDSSIFMCPVCQTRSFLNADNISSENHAV